MTRGRVEESERTTDRSDRARAGGGAGRSHVSELASTVGNRALLRLARDGWLKAKRNVSIPSDPSEIQADQVAAKLTGECPSCVAGGPCTGCGPSISRSAASAGEPPRVDVEAVRAGLGAGHSLDGELRRSFEPQLGIDLGQVRVHTGTSAHAAARSVDARAFTIGRDVVFGEGQYRPTTPDGKRLVAHELAHVVQNRSTGESTVAREPDETSGDAR